jgi:peptidoglycan-associated lipoprotein
LGLHDGQNVAISSQLEGLFMHTLFTMIGRLGVAALLAGTVAATACGPKAKPPEAPQQVQEEPKNEPLTATITPAPAATPPPSEPIYFDFDSFTIQDASKTTLQRVAEYLNKNADSTVTISGHTDERGTTEYNLMLGDQRAKAAHDYLVRLGIDPVRIKTISFGEERPAVPGEGEEAWSKNRRDEFNTNTR